MAFGARRSDRWAIILAGGEGLRLRPLTRRIAGDERPKQFCPLLDGVTLLDRTRARVTPTVGPDRTCLGTRPANLAVLPVRGVTWSDWGDPARVLQTLGRLGVHPEWAEGEAALAGVGSRSGR
jgi:hypothetical protein